MDALAKVSIVIVTYKGDGILRDCLESLRSSCGLAPQIVVVDNSPSHSTEDIVQRHPNAVYVKSPGNPGFAGGNNLAMPFCDRQYVLLLNNDTIVKSRQAIEDMVGFLERNPSCAVVQGTITLPNEGGAAGGCGSYLTPFGFQYARGFGIALDTPRLNRPVKVFSIIGAFMLFERGILREVSVDGGDLFYGHFRSYYEESDFCHRVWLVGREVWYLPTEPIEHLCGATSRLFQRREIMRQYIRNSFFSLCVNLSLPWRIPIVFNFTFVILLHALLLALKREREAAKAEARAVLDAAKERKRIHDARQALNRKVSDWHIMKQVLRIPSIGYLLRSFSR